MRGLKQEELAKMAHVSQSVLSRIESGKYNETLSVPTLFDIADGLQIDMSLLVSFNEVEKQMWWRTLPNETDEVTETEEK